MDGRVKPAHGGRGLGVVRCLRSGNLRCSDYGSFANRAHTMKYANRLLCPLLLCLLPLAGCSHTMYLTDADQHGGTVNMVTTWSEDTAFEKAQDHCAQYHRTA